MSNENFEQNGGIRKSRLSAPHSLLNVNTSNESERAIKKTSHPLYFYGNF
jgi:hypothetical protein